MNQSSQDLASQNLQKYQKFNFWSLLFWSLVIVILALKLIVFQQVTVVGDSMNPSYVNGELLMVNQVNKSIQRGFVVAVYEDETVSVNANYFTRYYATFFLKRVIALPGEEVEIIASKVIIYNSDNPSGMVLDEPYISDTSKASEEQENTYYPRTAIPAGEYFVLGDNRSNSTDSRVRGNFPSYSMFGVVSMRFWPLNDVSVTDHHEYTTSPLTTELEIRRGELQELRKGSVNQFFRY
jgi:signal peptidase I